MQPLYVSERAIAKMLGHDTAWLKKNSSTLERQYGFPKIDPAIGKRHAPSVAQWAMERNSVTRAHVTRDATKNVENVNAL